MLSIIPTEVLGQIHDIQKLLDINQSLTQNGVDNRNSLNYIKQ